MTSTPPPVVSTPTNDVIAPPAFTTKGKRLLVAFLDDDGNSLWNGIVQCDSFNVDYDGDGDPEVTVRFELTSEEDPTKSRRRRKSRPTGSGPFPPIGSGGTLTVGGGSGYTTRMVSFTPPSTLSASHVAVTGTRGDHLVIDGTTYAYDGTDWQRVEPTP